jgi:hypothetical protein
MGQVRLMSEGAKYWSELFLKQAQLQAARKPTEPETPRPWHPADPIHPLILRLDNLSHEREAERVIAERREAARREAERKAQPHPLTQPPYVHIPIPDRAKPKREPDSVLSPEQQRLVNELMAKARRDER